MTGLVFALAVARLEAQPSPEEPTIVTNTLAADLSPALRDYLQAQERANLVVQEKLQSALQALEQNRHEAELSARRNADTIATQLKEVEKALTLQQERERDALERSNRFLLVCAGVFGAVGLLAMVFTASFLLRAVNRLVQIASQSPQGAGLAGAQTTPALGLGETAMVGLPPENTRLLGAIERLEKRIGELEHLPELDATPVAPVQANGTLADQEGTLSEPVPPRASEPAGPTKENRISLILGKGQTLLSLDQPEEALTCFDEALRLAPEHAESLVKKGTALERLKRWDEALACYDQAIAADSSMTVAYLYKGGVFNQLERFSEALECYEQALRAQQKAAVS